MTQISSKKQWPGYCPAKLKATKDVLLNGKSVYSLGVIFADTDMGVVRVLRKKPRNKVIVKGGEQVWHELTGKVEVVFK